MRPIFGLAMVLSWQRLTFLEWHFFERFPELPIPSPYWSFTVFSSFYLMGCLLIACCANRVPERSCSRMMWLSASLMSLFVSLPLLFDISASPVLGMLLFTLFPALGSALLLCAWQWRFCSLSFTRQLLFFAGACVAGSIVQGLLAGLPREFLWVCVLLFPFAGVLLWSFPGEREGPAPLPAMNPFPLRMTLCIASFFVACAVFHTLLPVRPSEGKEWAWRLTDPLYGLGALAVWLVVRGGSDIDLRNIYQWAQAVLGLGFVLYLLKGKVHPVFPLALLQLGYGFFGAYVFALFAYWGSFFCRAGSLRIVAMGRAIVAASLLLGAFLIHLVGFGENAGTQSFLGSPGILGLVFLFVSGFFLQDDRQVFAGLDPRLRAC